MATSAAVNIGAPAWGLYANSGNLSEAKRLLTNTLAVGQTVLVMFDHGFLDPGTSAGVALQNNVGDTLWQFYFHGGKTNYDITGSTSDIQWSPGGHAIEVTLTSPTTYVSRITPLGGSTRTNAGTLFITNNMNITVFRAWNWNAGAGPDYDVFFNTLKIITTNAGAGSSTSDTVTITRQTGITDADSDGMPDAWEQKYFNNPTGASAGVDSDFDGVDNWEEFVADTNPTNASSVYPNLIQQWTPDVAIMALEAGSPTTNSRVYDVWVTTNLMNPSWSPRYLNVPGALNGGPITLAVTNIGERGYYRTGVKLP
jgi:hypothetical protein